jgi:glucose/arabinose dehydrogenase
LDEHSHALKIPARVHYKPWFNSIGCALLIQLWALHGHLGGAVANPKRDPVDQLFRRAPMAESSRSIVIPLATNLHLAFDAHLCRTHAVWSGPGLNLQGPPYTGQKSPFLCNFDGEALWGNPPVFPWQIGRRADTDQFQRPEGARFKGISARGGAVTLMYELALKEGKSVRIHETPRQEMIGNAPAVVRRFEISSCEQDLFYLAHAVLMQGWLPGNLKSAMAIQTGNGYLTLLWRADTALEWAPGQEKVNYQVLLQTEKDGKGPDSDVKTNLVVGIESRAWLRIPAYTNETVFEIVSLNSPERIAPETLAKMAGGTVAPANMAFVGRAAKNSKAPTARVFVGDVAAVRRQSGDEFYPVEHFPLPREVDLLVGGMDWFSNGDLAICTWPGEVYVVRNAQGPVEKAAYHRFARGLNEPLGMIIVNDRIYVAQKCELTRLTDTDGDGEADLYETINDEWGYTGNYHSYAFGPLIDRENNFYLFLTGQRGRWDVPYVGWCVRINSDGSSLEGFCSGLRAPNGWAVFGPDRDLFATDNQGEWIGACKLNHLQRGGFYGFPSGVPAPQADYTRPENFHPPAVWFPRTLAPSASGLEVITDDRFGPFKGQMLVGDFQNSIVMRVALEKVKGDWQGAVWPFAKGFAGAVNRLSMGPDGKLYVGGCKRAWSTPAPVEYSLERVSFGDKMPFEVKEVRARQDGLELIFMQPVDRTLAGDPENYEVRQFTYRYHSAYGSPEIDYDGKDNSSSPVQVSRVEVSPDRFSVQLRMPGLRAGYVTAVRILEVKSDEGRSLWHDTFYYTLNRVPD